MSETYILLLLTVLGVVVSVAEALVKEAAPQSRAARILGFLSALLPSDLSKASATLRPPPSPEADAAAKELAAMLAKARVEVEKQRGSDL